MKEDASFEAIIIGGSFAGLSAAMSLGRSLRKVLVIDNGKPCNWQTPYSHNFITNDGKTPAAIFGEAKLQVLKYPTVEIIDDTAIKAQKSGNGFEIETESGAQFFSKKLILATGIRDIMPQIKGFSDCWGISILHCPYCHGYEFRNERIGILADGPLAYELAKLISNWTDDLTIFTKGITIIDEEHLQKLEAHNIKIIEKEIRAFHHEKGRLKHIEFNDTTIHPIVALFTRPPFEQSSKLPEILGCKFDEKGMIQVDEYQKTSIDGVFAAGDCTTLFRSIAAAVASGNLAGAILNKELIEENF